MHGQRFLALHAPENEHARIRRGQVQVVALGFVAMQLHLEARMQPLRDAIALEEKPLRAAVVAANHTVRLPDDVCPAALRGPALHHDCEGKLRLLHSPALYPSAMISPRETAR